jgi:hypothetical protein
MTRYVKWVLEKAHKYVVFMTTFVKTYKRCGRTVDAKRVVGGSKLQSCL